MFRYAVYIVDKLSNKHYILDFDPKNKNKP